MTLNTILDRMSRRVRSSNKRKVSLNKARRRSRFEALEQRRVLNADWTVAFGGLGKDTVNAGVEVDAADNVYIAGDYTGTIDLAPDQDIQGDTLSSAGSRDTYLAKYDPGGQLLWAKSFGGAEWDLAWGVAVDSAGNSFISGTFTGTVDLDPGAGIVQRTATGQNDAFVVKLDASGNFQWVQTASGDLDDGFVSVHTDSQGDVYLETDSNSLSTVHGSHIATGDGAFARFVSKLDGANGGFEWVREFRTDQDVGGAAIGISSDGTSVSVAGSFIGTLDVGNGSDALQTAGGDRDSFVVVLDAQTGVTSSATSFSGIGRSANWANVFDNDGSLLLTGQFEGEIDFGSSPDLPGSSNTLFATASQDGVSRSDVYVVRLDGNLDVLTTYQFGGPGYETPWATNSLVIYPDGNEIVVGGQFEGLVDTGAGVLASSGEMDGFLVALDSTLTPQWAERMGGAGSSGSGLDDSDNFAPLFFVRDDPFDDGVSGVAYDSAGNLLVTGDFKSDAAFPAGETASSNGDADVFLLKLDRSVPRISGNIFADFAGDGIRGNDTVRNDRFREGILASDGWAVELVDPDGTVINTATPLGNSGNYSFEPLDDVPSGTYTVRVMMPDGWTATTAAGGYEVSLQSGVDPLRLDFGATHLTTERGFASTDVGQTIRNKTVESVLTVADEITIFDIDVELDISHTFNSDLEVFLVAPDGVTEVELFTRVGGSGNGFPGVVLDDDVAPIITQATSSISGSFKPEGDLQKLVSKQAQGDWTLRINDVARGNNGQLNGWSLKIFGATPAPAPPAPPTIDSLVASPSSVVQGAGLTLTANGVADDSAVVRVDFYHDNGDGTLDTAVDTLFGVDTNGADGWSTTGAAAFPIGTATFFAIATDDAELPSNLVLTTVDVIEDPGGSATDIYVWDIGFTTRNRGKNTDLRIVIDVNQDFNMDGVASSSDAGAQSVLTTVELRDSSGGLVGAYSGTTDSDGIFRKGWIRGLAADTYTAEVVDLAHASLFWNQLLDPNGDDEDADGDGLPDDMFVLV